MRQANFSSAKNESIANFSFYHYVWISLLRLFILFATAVDCLQDIFASPDMGHKCSNEFIYPKLSMCIEQWHDKTATISNWWQTGCIMNIIQKPTHTYKLNLNYTVLHILRKFTKQQVKVLVSKYCWFFTTKLAKAYIEIWL